MGHDTSEPFNIERRKDEVVVTVPYRLGPEEAIDSGCARGENQPVTTALAVDSGGTLPAACAREKRGDNRPPSTNARFAFSPAPGIILVVLNPPATPKREHSTVQLHRVHIVCNVCAAPFTNQGLWPLIYQYPGWGFGFDLQFEPFWWRERRRSRSGSPQSLPSR